MEFFFFLNFKNSFRLYTCKQPLMMAYEMSKSVWDNFGKFIHQFQPETKTLIRKLERILIKLYRQSVSLLFNQTCLYIYIYIYIYIYTHTHTHTCTYKKICIKHTHICMHTYIHTHTHLHITYTHADNM